MATVTIPLVTLPVGPMTFGPVSAADSDGTITLTIDRTVAAGLNSLSAASTIQLILEQSNDGGASWRSLGGTTFVGGIFTYKGSTAVQNVAHWTLFDGTSRQLRATVTVAGTPVAVAGTLTSS